MNRWSSYPAQQRLVEKWQRFVEEEQKVFGINSEPDINPESLLSMLSTLVKKGVIDQGLQDDLIGLMLAAADQDDVVLEALGGRKQRDPRTFSDQTTYALNDLITAAGLSPDAQEELEKTLNQWARLNTVEFSSDAIPGLGPSELPPPGEEEPPPTVLDPSTWTTPEDLWQMLDTGEEDDVADPWTYDPGEEPTDDEPEEPSVSDEESTDLPSFLANNQEYIPMDTYAKDWIAHIIDASPESLRPWTEQLNALLRRAGGVEFDPERAIPVQYLDPFSYEEHTNDWLHPDEHFHVRDVGSAEKKNLFVLTSAATEASNQRNSVDLPMEPPRLSLQEALFKQWQLIAGITKKVI